ncbi:hypothetical protein Plhal703r1_c04g0022391 [Plasmopara halstedii]
MLASLARSLGVFKARGKYESQLEIHKSPDIKERIISKNIEGEKYNRLREIVLKFEPFLLKSWKRLGVSAKQAEEILDVNLSRLYFLENPNLPLYIKFLTMTPRYEHLNPYETLLLDMKKQGLLEDEIVLTLGGCWCNDQTQFYPTKLYHIIVPDLAITMKNLENGKLSVWITYFERLSKPDLYKELAQVIVTSKMVESDTGLKIVTVEKSVDNNMPPIPERDRQLADLLALRVFDTDRSSLTRSEQLKPHELDLVKADRERRKLFFASLFKGLRMYWSRCRLSPENIFPLTKTENLVHEQLLSSPHLWTFMAYTADHIEKNDDCGEQMLKVLMEKLNEEEIARLPAVMTDEDDGIFSRCPPVSLDIGIPMTSH